MIGWILAGLAGVALMSEDTEKNTGPMVKSWHCDCRFCGGTAKYEFAGEDVHNIYARFRCDCGRVWTKEYEK